MPRLLPFLSMLAAVPALLPAQSWPVLAARPVALHSQAAINDPRSHGAIGDRLLSLAEAILLTNRDIDENALSAEEVAQLSGFGGDIAWADIDAAVVPLITLERELPVIRDTPHGFKINGTNGTPTIDLGDTRGIVARSDFVDFENLRLRGGAQGILLEHDSALFGTLIGEVDFEGQDLAGVSMEMLTAGGNARVQLDSCRFRGLPVAIAIRDVGANRSGRFEIFGDTRIDGCTRGVELLLGAGGQTTLYVNGLAAAGGDEAFVVRRTQASGTRALSFEARHARLEGARAALVIDGDPLSQTLLSLQALDLRSPGLALGLGPIGSAVDAAVEDSRFRGELRLHGGANGRVLLDNADLRGGSSSLGTTGASATIERSLLDAVALTTAGQAAVVVRDSVLRGGSVAGTASAPLRVEDGFSGGTTFGPHATELRPLPAAHRGRFDGSPAEPLLGTALTLFADLPQGLDGLVALGRTREYPAAAPQAQRLYADPAALALLPSPLRGTQQVTLPIPPVPALAGLDLYFHLAVLPQPGTNAPALALPPGHRARLR